MTSTAESILSGLSLPTGNQPFVQEKKVVTKAVETSVKEITVLGDSPEAVENVTGFPTLQEVEKNYIFKVLGAVNGNKTKAAEVLGVSIKTIYNKLNSYSPDKNGGN